MPLAVLETDVAIDANRREAHRLVQRDARRVGSAMPADLPPPVEVCLYAL